MGVARSRALGSVLVGALALSVAMLSTDSQVVGAEPEESQPQDEEQRPDSAPDPVTAGDRKALGARIDAIVSEADKLASARIGVLAVDVASGEVLYERQADEAFNIASNTKTLTTAAALHYLGPEHRFRTSLFAAKVDRDTVVGDLYLVGGGDPALGTYELEWMVDRLVQQGIRKIRGGIVIDATLFDGQVSPPHFDSQPKEQAAFRAPVAALSLNFNAVAIVVRPNPAGAGPAVVTVDPPNDYVTIRGQIQTVTSGRDRVRMESVEKPDGHLEIVVGGQLPVRSGVRRYRRRIGDPLQYAGAAWRAALRERGISVRTTVSAGSRPDDAVWLVTHVSPPMAELIRGMGKSSNNYVAETVLKAIGAAQLEIVRPATWDDGLGAVRRYLESEVGITGGGYRYENGSGLFNASALSPRQMVKALAHAARDYRYGPDLVASLSIAGTDGTLRKRMRKTPAAGLVRAKTGTLAQVSTLAGYVAVDALRPVAFAVFVNDQPRSWRAKQQARSTQDRIAAALARYLGAP